MQDNSKNTISNDDVASLLSEIADLMEQSGKNEHRIRAYRNAAAKIRGLDEPIKKIDSQGGEKALEEIKGIGKSLSGLIHEYCETGHSSLLERLEAELSPKELLEDLPGIGPELADKIVDELGIRSLEELERAAHDGRLEKLSGFGEDRVEAMKEILSAKLSRSAQRKSRQRQSGKEEQEKERPSDDLILEVDKEYREKAEAGELKTIAPKRFNPEGKAWLPIYKTEKEGWTFTALYSNTAKAHKRGKTHDWVVIYYEAPGHKDQCTVISAESGPQAGKRFIAGR